METISQEDFCEKGTNCIASPAPSALGQACHLHTPPFPWAPSFLFHTKPFSSHPVTPSSCS